MWVVADCLFLAVDLLILLIIEINCFEFFRTMPNVRVAIAPFPFKYSVIR